MKLAVVVLALLVGWSAVARADDPDPKRKIVVLEYRSGSSAVPKIADRIVAVLRARTSLKVIGPDQARVAYGDSVDQVMVKCAGDATCVAKIGDKVGASEVILVAISELGDVILTIQRIDVAFHTVSSRIAETLAAGAAPTDAQLEDFLGRMMPGGDFLRYGVIDIVANLGGAAVTISGEPRGTTPLEPLKLRAPATYNIRIEKTGYVPYTTKIELPPDGTIKVEATLSKRGAVSWYQHWYVLAAAGVLVAGAGGTAIYFATRPDGPGDGQVTVGGTIN
ncbi:MAG: PEGA domain-containing protein [Proteobacteria bacterium]|nr:PEGA domain-containing protein [Pseudomonadota bacterium]